MLLEMRTFQYSAHQCEEAFAYLAPSIESVLKMRLGVLCYCTSVWSIKEVMLFEIFENGYSQLP